MTERRLALMFLLAAGLSVALHLVQPWGPFVLYPLALLGTWAHEMGHGLTAWLVGGSFERLHVYADLGGVAVFRLPEGGAFWRVPLVSIGGLLGPAVAGGLVVYLGARRPSAPWVLALMSVALWASLVLWVRNPFGMVLLAVLSLALIAVALVAPVFVRVGLAQLIGIQLCLSSLTSFDYMFTHSFTRDGEVMLSDTQRIAEHLLLPYWFWGVVVAGLSVAILVGALWWAWAPVLRKGAGRARAA